jgi:hypothetical protein
MPTAPSMHHTVIWVVRPHLHLVESRATDLGTDLQPTKDQGSGPSTMRGGESQVRPHLRPSEPGITNTWNHLTTDCGALIRAMHEQRQLILGALAPPTFPH